MLSPFTQIVSSLGVALILTIALWDAHRGSTSVGEFVAFLTTPVVTGLIQARACFEMMDTPAEPDPGHLELSHSRGELKIEDLTVVHGGSDSPALRGISLKIGAGQTVAFVGPSGAGKSTLVGTLLGFVEPTAGRVRLDDIDLTALRKASLRRQFAVVSQDIVLFDASIIANVAYGQVQDEARVERCLRAAQLWEFVAGLPEGVHTGVGNNGARLSGGQRQRLAIARALYKAAPIWIFDEATSSLDSESERAVHDAITEQRGERTLILIAHRLSTVRHADWIFVLDEGRIVEQGPHDRLSQADGRYAAMVRAQIIH